MRHLRIRTQLAYSFADPTDVLLQLEAAALPEQRLIDHFIDINDCQHFSRVAGHDQIGDRIWLSVAGTLRVNYRATVAVARILSDPAGLERVPAHLLPGETVEYLMPSRYCPSDQFEIYVEAEFGSLQGGARVMAMRDWIYDHFSYVPGSSDSGTTALETFVKRQGICRDYAHVLITLTRASGIPARMASVYALGVEPPDFHAVAEVFLGGAWHLLDPTGMAIPSDMAKIGIGRDAADVAFLTAYGPAELLYQSVAVEAG